MNRLLQVLVKNNR